MAVLASLCHKGAPYTVLTHGRVLNRCSQELHLDSLHAHEHRSQRVRSCSRVRNRSHAFPCVYKQTEKNSTKRNCVRERHINRSASQLPTLLGDLNIHICDAVILHTIYGGSRRAPWQLCRFRVCVVGDCRVLLRKGMDVIYDLWVWIIQSSWFSESTHLSKFH